MICKFKAKNGGVVVAKAEKFISCATNKDGDTVVYFEEARVFEVQETPDQVADIIIDAETKIVAKL